MWKLAICDDEAAARTGAEAMVRRWESESGNHFSLLSFESGAALLSSLEGDQHFDIFLLDIVMPLVDGISLAGAIRRIDEAAVIIFLTSSPEFAVESYDVSAFGYLMKPVSYEKLSAVLSKALHSFARREQDGILLRSGGKLISVERGRIEYAEVQRDRLFYYLSGGEKLETRGTMSELEQQLLTDPGFVKPHRSYIVNMNAIRELSSREILLNGDFSPIPVSRNLSGAVREAYLGYMVQMAGGGETL